MASVVAVRSRAVRSSTPCASYSCALSDLVRHACSVSHTFVQFVNGIMVKRVNIRHNQLACKQQQQQQQSQSPNPTDADD